jgi:hypothetical protein
MFPEVPSTTSVDRDDSMPPPEGGAEKDPRSEPPEGLTSVGSTGGAAGEGPSPVNGECQPNMVCPAVVLPAFAAKMHGIILQMPPGTAPPTPPIHATKRPPEEAHHSRVAALERSTLAPPSSPAATATVATVADQKPEAEDEGGGEGDGSGCSSAIVTGGGMVLARRGEDVCTDGWEGDTKKKGEGKREKDAEKTGGKAAEERGDEERNEPASRSEERERERKRVARESGKMQKELGETKKEKNENAKYQIGDSVMANYRNRGYYPARICGACICVCVWGGL